MKRLLPIILLALAWPAPAGQPGQPPEARAENAAEPPPWASSLRLIVHGGPVQGELEVSLNGEFVAEFGEDPALFTEIADMVRPGVNELKVGFKPPTHPRTQTEQVTIAIGNVEVSGSRTRSLGDPLAVIVIPQDAGSDAACQGSTRFWAGPTEKGEEAPLKNTYWLFIAGPPVKSRVAVFVNDRFVFEASSGDMLVEITPFARKGKNLVVFEERPTCLVPKSGRTGPLLFSVAPGELKVDTVTTTGRPLVELQVDPHGKSEVRSTQRAFRAY